jgi:BirA family transcriptional regulator, biotin operon repressor / biotin---[acetyl-CoA-carboxylase] ligase
MTRRVVCTVVSKYMNDLKYQQEFNRLAEHYSLDRIKLNLFNCLDSTNNKSWQLIESGERFPAATIALQQTAGKGQWGKSWQSGLGGLYLSVALECDLALENSFHLVMATAVGITNILRHYGLPVTLKWSNDLILESRKLGGIKIETKTRNKIIKCAVVGVGINWENIVPETGINIKYYYQKRIDNIERSRIINSLEQLTAITIIGLLQGYQDYLQLGIDRTLQQYQQLLNNIGQQIVINNSFGTITGVNTRGQLKVHLQSPNATTEIYLSPGEISLGY